VTQAPWWFLDSATEQLVDGMQAAKVVDAAGRSRAFDMVTAALREAYNAGRSHQYAPDDASPTTPGPWRTGSQVHRTIYGDASDGKGRLIGLMDRPEDAALVVQAVNERAALDDVARAAEAVCQIVASGSPCGLAMHNDDLRRALDRLRDVTVTRERAP
jgi:hypothetical protein